MSGKIIAVASQKGGVGKTTTVRNLSKGLSMAGKKVLVVDLDTQASLTSSFGIEEPEKLQYTIADLMALIIEEKDLPDDDFVIRNIDGVDLIPSSIDLSSIELSLINAMSREYVLKEIIEDLRENYDYILLDCMPSLGLITINALVSADTVLIPATPEFFSAKGIEKLIETVFKVKKRLNKQLQFEGILITANDIRTKLSKKISNAINETYGEHIKMFDVKISSTVKVGESIAEYKSVIEYDKNCKASKEYIELAEIICKEK